MCSSTMCSWFIWLNYVSNVHCMLAALSAPLLISLGEQLLLLLRHPRQTIAIMMGKNSILIVKQYSLTQLNHLSIHGHGHLYHGETHKWRKVVYGAGHLSAHTGALISERQHL